MAEQLGIPSAELSGYATDDGDAGAKLESVKDISNASAALRPDTTAHEYMQELPESVQQMVGMVYAMLTGNAGSGKVN